MDQSHAQFHYVPKDLREGLRAEEERLTMNLRRLRADFSNAGNKGSGSEVALRGFLRKYLPRMYMVGHGEVIDPAGTRTTQTDVVITSPDHPATVADEEAGLALSPGVTALDEVKSVLTTKELASTVKAAQRSRKLRYAMVGTVVQGKRADAERYGTSPPYFLFAYESRISRESIVKTIRSESMASGSDMGRQTRTIDAVFTLDVGSVIYLGDGQGSVQMLTTDGKVGTGWGGVEPGVTLLFLLAWLTATMPKREHPRAIWSEIIFASSTG